MHSHHPCLTCSEDAATFHEINKLVEKQGVLLDSCWVLDCEISANEEDCLLIGYRMMGRVFGVAKEPLAHCVISTSNNEIPCLLYTNWMFWSIELMWESISLTQSTGTANRMSSTYLFWKFICTSDILKASSKCYTTSETGEPTAVPRSAGISSHHHNRRSDNVTSTCLVRLV